MPDIEVVFARGSDEHAMLPTSIQPGRSGCPRGQRSGGRTIHAPDVDRTNSPTAAIPQR
jgi:hypothetical protein